MVSIGKSVNGLNQGANDPLIKSAIQCGIDKHKSMGSCDVREATVSSRYCPNPNPTRMRADWRIDCLSGCMVIEFKPNNPKATETGTRQARAYADALTKWYRTEGDQMFKGDFEKLRSCVKGSGDSKDLEVFPKVEVYNFCECFPDLMVGVPRQEPTVEVPERER